MKKRYSIILSVIAVVVIALIYYSAKDTETVTTIETEVQKGKFDVIVAVTGELQAKNSVRIEAPIQALRNIWIWEVTIAQIIPEGTVVDSGDFVARLDDSNVRNRLNDIEQEIEKSLDDIERAKIDSSLDLRNERDRMINLDYAVQEAQIALEQSKYESPSVIRKAKIDLDKTIRELDQAKGNYDLKIQQAKVTIRQKTLELNKKLRQKDDILSALEQLEIYAPASGMVIYYKDRDGSKRTVNTNIRLRGEAVVATLPDLSSFNSLTYVNEIDISKIKKGQPVQVGIDAFPEKKFTGIVKNIANIGEQLPNTDAKVFEVEIALEQTDDQLRPAMTTSNTIITQTFEDVLYLPLEAIHTNDSLPFVYLKNKTRQLVLLGESNDDEIIIEKGLDEKDKVLLSIPEDGEEYKMAGLELIALINERRQQKEQEQKRAQQAVENKGEPLNGQGQTSPENQVRRKNR
ncbi:MAG: efflux RND transporter periplasmic adaptor subunit [Bacteroidales bacterium]|nr:efflux RND transporter periplasmic adaptor subunit [Bacteroidales bacterium]